jgi:hypothetical protein
MMSLSPSTRVFLGRPAAGAVDQLSPAAIAQLRFVKELR